MWPISCNLAPIIYCLSTSRLAQLVKNLSAMWETWVQSLGQEDAPEKEMATHSGILAWRIPRAEELSRLQSMGSQRVGHDWASNTFNFHLKEIYVNTSFFPFQLILSSKYLQYVRQPLCASVSFSIKWESNITIWKGCFKVWMVLWM